MRTLAVASLLIAGVAGCEYNLAAVSSGQIGCAESDITISGDTSEYHTRTWIADCNGKSYYCSATGGGHSLVVSCHLPESTSRPASPPPQATGCTYDTQCKGDRICKAGRCVDPGPKATPDGGAAAQ